MTMITRKIIIATMIKHETLTIVDIAKKANLGIVPIIGQLNYLIRELLKEGFIIKLNGAIPCTYTITDKGILEGERLNRV